MTNSEENARSWENLLGNLLECLQGGETDGALEATSDLQRMAFLADRYVRRNGGNDATPTWEGMLPVLLVLAGRGSECKELTRMAKLADLAEQLPYELVALAARVRADGVETVTVRELLQWFGSKRRGKQVVTRITQALQASGLDSEVFESAAIDDTITFEASKQPDAGIGRGAPAMADVEAAINGEAIARVERLSIADLVDLNNSDAIASLAALSLADLRHLNDATGSSHTCGLVSGLAYCWGENYYGQLGDGTTTSRSLPTPVIAPGLSFRSILATGQYTCAVTASGYVYCWGSNGGQFGDGTNNDSKVPVLVAGGSAYSSISGGGSHSCGVNAAGNGYCWGNGSYGQLGDGGSNSHYGPTAVSGGIVFSAIGAGTNHSCGLSLAGAVLCWGLNYSGQVGNGTSSYTSVTQPTVVRLP